MTMARGSLHLLAAAAARKPGPGMGLLTQGADDAGFSSAWARPFRISSEGLEFHSPTGIQEFCASFRGNLEGTFPGAEVSAMVQQTRLKMNAKGTMGAAVTKLARLTGAPIRPETIIEFAMDRPHVVIVADTRSGWPLFLAKVFDAAAAQNSR